MYKTAVYTLVNGDI